MTGRWRPANLLVRKPLTFTNETFYIVKWKTPKTNVRSYIKSVTFTYRLETYCKVPADLSEKNFHNFQLDCNRFQLYNNYRKWGKGMTWMKQSFKEIVLDNPVIQCYNYYRKWGKGNENKWWNLWHHHCNYR